MGLVMISCLRPWGRSGCVIRAATRWPVSHSATNVGSAKSPVPSITIREEAGRVPLRSSEGIQLAARLFLTALLAAGLRLAELRLERRERGPRAPLRHRPQ